MDFEAFYSGSAGNLYRAKHWNSNSCLMIEAGVGLSKVVSAFNYRLTHECVGLLVSHSHKDHCKSASDLARLGIDCYMTKETARDLNFFELHSDRLKLVELNKPIAVDQFKVIAFQTIHDCPGSVGFLVTDGKDKLLYASDTFYIPNQFRGLSIIAIECNYSNETLAEDIDESLKRRIQTTHLSLETVLSFLESTDRSKLREVHLLHLSDSNSNAEKFKTEVQQLTGVPVYVAGV